MSTLNPTMAALKSKRKPNFTEVENLFLIEEFENNKEILRSKVNSTEMNRQKLDVWQRICDVFNRRNPLVKRSVDEVRRKWKNMVTTARKDMAHYNPSKPPSELSQRIMRGYSEPPYDDSKQELTTNHKHPLSPTGSESGGSSSGVTREVITINDDAICKTEGTSSVELSLENVLEEVSPRIDEVRAAVGCGMEVVQPGPPAAALTEQTRQNMRRSTPNEVATRPKRNSIQTILYNAKKRRLQGQSLGSSPSLDIQQLQKEKLTLEKEKIVLEKEKLMLEKEKLMLEIQCLRSQLSAEDTEF